MISKRIDKSTIKSIETHYLTETGTLKLGNAEFANTYGDGEFYLGLGPISNSDKIIGIVTDAVVIVVPFAKINTANHADIIFFGRIKLNGRWAVCQCGEGDMQLNCLDADNWTEKLEFDGEFNSYNSEGKELLDTDIE